MSAKTLKEIYDEDTAKINANFELFAKPFRDQRDKALEQAKEPWRADKKAADDRYHAEKRKIEKKYIESISQRALERDQEIARVWVQWRKDDRST